MPVAVASKEPGESIELKTLPGAWVKLRKLDYGELLHRRDIASGASGRPGQDTINLHMDNLAVELYEFSLCIVDHNLFEDAEETRKLDMSNPLHIKMLDPKVAQEIEEHINNLNNFEGLEEESKRLS